jgi:hypothetical protein
MIEMNAVFLRQDIKAHRMIIFDYAIAGVSGDELRSHGQHIAPRFNPAFRITPVAFRGMRNLGQLLSIFRFGANDLHGGSSAPRSMFS